MLNNVSTAAQLLELRDAPIEKKLDYLIDHMAICDLIQRYGQGTDTHDFQLLRTCYGDYIEVDHSPTIGMGRIRVSADKWCSLAEKFHSQLDGDEHVMIPQSIVIHGDTASCRVLMHASHFYRDAAGSPYQTLVGSYDLKFVRSDDGWKISESVQSVSWTEGNWQFHNDIKNSLGTPDLD
ncbi:nuclear transport factor 2 family protein [Neorhizobium sp. NPDC001467]|uniref:nuclear transport factor 2 family protein n=1 Tax=Neorhizobium sp. NPDC001467 TaxID=3390595 RepID=UPI003D02D925